MTEHEFKTLVLNYQDRVYNTCLGFLRDSEDARDIAQEVFIQVFKSYDTFLGKAQIGTWIYRITVNKCNEEIRNRSRLKRSGEHVELQAEIATSFYHPGVEMENKERSVILFEAISMLPDQQQTAFILNKVEGLSYEEIGVIMNKSYSSIESLLHRAKLKLREILKEYHEEVS